MDQNNDALAQTIPSDAAAKQPIQTPNPRIRTIALVLFLVLAVGMIILIFILPSGKTRKQITQRSPTPSVTPTPTIPLKTEYANPFDKKSTYQNPFTTSKEYKNPFDTTQ